MAKIVVSGSFDDLRSPQVRGSARRVELWPADASQRLGSGRPAVAAETGVRDVFELAMGALHGKNP